MPRKSFFADLERIQRPGGVDSCISDVHRGDDDGSFNFTFTPGGTGSGNRGIGITAMIPELSDYPDSHQTYLYTNSEAPGAVTSALAKFSPEIPQPLSVLLAAVSRSLSKAMGNSGLEDSVDSDVSMEDNEFENSDEDFQNEEDDIDEEDDLSIGGWEEDYQNPVGRVPQLSSPEKDEFSQENLSPTEARRLREAFRRDLRSAKMAGFKIGVLGDYRGGMDLYVSLGIRVSKLGISNEAIDAWKLDKRKYFILLIHYSSYYQTLEKLTGESGGYHAKKSVELCVGTATRYKPTLLEAIGAFSKISAFDSTQASSNGSKEGDNGEGVTEEISHEDGFRGVFISRPLNELLNSRLIQLVKYRIQHGFGWDGAERYYIDSQGRESNSLGHIDSRYYDYQEPKRALSKIITDDAFTTSSPKDASFPLLAMQLALRHLVRCTEFCLVCHTKVQNDFEALKPYVCSSPLCLYQYMSLGFGPSIEHEIISQPTVVDLLISFCYISARFDKLDEFPSGMNLTVPDTPLETFQANYHRTKHELLLSQGPDTVRPPLKVGDWVMINVEGNGGIALETFHARVTETDYFPKVRISPPVGVTTPTFISVLPNSAPAAYRVSTNPFSASVPVQPPQPSEQQQEPINELPRIVPVSFSIYSANFDSLPKQKKTQSILQILETLPSVAEMRLWLQRNTKVGEEANLKMWKSRISPPALGILRWIIASNRSCIVPVDHELDPCGSIINGLGSKRGSEQRVWGMGDWLQFRFAMGAPDKEQRFLEAVQDAQKRLNQLHSSLFAFHGSPLSNWHSIIREGLHFKKTQHGRAYGNGCYHSLDLHVSMGYSGTLAPSNFGQTMIVPSWSQSVLKIEAAISLNEIVNAPNEFVSKTPHLVVDQLDWIQTRYLFIKIQGSKSVPVDDGSNSRPTLIHPQDEVFTPKGFFGNLIIPATVSSYRARNLLFPGGPAPPTPSLSPTKLARMKFKKISDLLPALGSFSNNSVILDDDKDDDLADDASIATENSDLLALISDDEDNLLLSYEESSNIDHKTKVSSPTNVSKAGAFVPGSLDISDLPTLPLPSYASGGASKRIQSDLRSIVRLQQAHPLEELGWYVDTSRTDNIYQWIVELHSFPENLPLFKDMKEKSVKSIVLEMRFGSQYPMSPPFIRVVKPRFMGFGQGGGGHVTVGGALCMELLTNSGWSAVSSLESVLLQVRMMIAEESPPARLAPGPVQSYSPSEAREAYLRACRAHGWSVPEDFASIV